MIAAFIKRMARLALSSPPASIVIIIPFIYNLLKRHPTCMQLIHGSATSEENDSYNHLEDDPMKCNALQSSLWEMQTLQNHFAPNVSTLAKIFNEQFTKPSYNLEDFLDHTYATVRHRVSLLCDCLPPLCQLFRMLTRFPWFVFYNIDVPKRGFQEA